MEKLYVSIDIGGTHSRLQCEIIGADQVIQKSNEYKSIIGDKRALEIFIQNSIKDFTDLKPDKCVTGFAGAVIDRKEVAMTNWLNRPVISKIDLIKWGLPESTFMVNDMELAGYGLLDMEAKNQIPSEYCKTLFMPENYSQKYSKHKLVIAPGTGFGTGCVIETKTQSGEMFYDVISSEVQHIQIPPFDEKHAEIMKMIFAKKKDRLYLNHEDFVSGEGLEDTYSALQKIGGLEIDNKNAAEIANLALQNKDDLAVEALNYFYRVVGRIVQAMCLVVQPYGGVFLCGASTEKNVDFIPQSDFLKELHNSLIRQEMLEQYPVYIVTKSDINVAGGLWACREIL
jgi:glucokinase